MARSNVVRFDRSRVPDDKAADWEPLGHNVRPFGPEDLEIREYPGSNRQKWYVRIRQRPNLVTVALSDPLGPTRLAPDDIKLAIAARLRKKLSLRQFDKDTDSLPPAFIF